MFRRVSLSIITSLVLYDIPVAVYTVIDSWWWTENLSETCRFLFQK